MDHRIKDWLPTLADAKRAPAERAFEYALMLGLGLFTAQGISPDTRLGYALVALGFAFAFAVLWGVVGRAKREWAAPRAPQDKAFLAPRSNIPTPVTPIASVAPAKRQLPTYEIEQKLMRYDALLAIIRERTAYIEGEGNGIKNNAWYAARLDAADRAKKIHDFREKAGATIQELEDFRITNAHHADVQSLLMTNDQHSEFLNAISHFGRTFERMALVKDVLSESDFMYVMEPRHDELARRLLDFARWRHKTINEIIALRQRLSST